MADRAARIRDEHELLRTVFKEIQYEPKGDWFFLENDTRAAAFGWTPTPFPVAFQAHQEHPGTPPYGIYVNPGVRLRGGTVPANFQPSAANVPPFAGEWAMLSWSIDGPWIPKVGARGGANLLAFVLGFEDRYKMDQ